MSWETKIPKILFYYYFMVKTGTKRIIISSHIITIHRGFQNRDSKQRTKSISHDRSTTIKGNKVRSMYMRIYEN